MKPAAIGEKILAMSKIGCGAASTKERKTQERSKTRKAWRETGLGLRVTLLRSMAYRAGGHGAGLWETGRFWGGEVNLYQVGGHRLHQGQVESWSWVSRCPSMACPARHNRPSVVPGSLDNLGKVMIGNKVIFAHANQNKTKKTTKMPLLKPILIVCVSHTVRMIQNVLACSFVRSEIGSGESQHKQGFSVIKLYPWLDQVQYSVRVWEKCLLPKRISLAMWHKDNCHLTQPLLKNFVLNVRTKLFAVRFLIFTSWSILLD